MEALVLFGSFFVLLLLMVPIGYAIGIATLIAIVVAGDGTIPLLMITQKAVTGVDSFPLMAIPFFMLAGNLMSGGGIAKRLINFFDSFMGLITGGLSMVTTVTCMFFAAISGSAVATTSAVGSFMVPEMRKRGYDDGFSASIAAAAGTIGVIIPPSVPFVIYGVATGTSITDLFKAGIIPGLGMGAALMIACYFLCKKHGFQVSKKGERKLDPRHVWLSFKDAFWAILSPVIILGGIYSGYFTPTEAAVVGVVYSFIVGRFVYRELDNAAAYKALRDTIVVNGSTTFMVGLSSAFAAYLSLAGIPRKLAAAMLSITDNKFILLLLINCFLLVVGCLVDNIPATIILAPILLPVVESLGMSAVTFGIMLTMNLAIGFCTPPYGIDLFVAQKISGVKMGQMLKYMWWFIFALLAVLMLTTFWRPFTMLML
ncbi:TRAP transporter large permease [Pseudoflavonifractor phocaeensis]|uniref:TRAP transporter large permease n=1 Tax=Pseudoflavonifractor phocaeensis TaxID=1870988 RepID=UPI001F1DFDF5|nr:TRAP transporter large permease [Pseudoflavonifractor phocaeensis]MCF2661954.1 TRAP transporter large permease [Pseudoflavonifractor phocaeensis]